MTTKIKLNSSDYIVIDIPQELNPQSLYGLVKRLQRIMKFLSNVEPTVDDEEEKEVKKPKYPKTNIKRNYTKEQWIEFLNLYFSGNVTELMSKFNLPDRDFYYLVAMAKKKVTPQDLGMAEFPNLRGRFTTK